MNLLKIKQTAVSLAAAGMLLGGYGDEAAGIQIYGVEYADYRIETGGVSYRVSGVLANNRSGPVTAMVEVADCPADGESVIARQVLDVPAKAGQMFQVDVVSPIPGPRRTDIRALDRESGKVIYVLPENAAALPKVMEAYFDRNYYTDEKEARAVFHVDAAIVHGKCNVRVEVMLDGGTSIRADAPVNHPARTAVSVRLDDVPCGSFRARFMLLNEAGKFIADLPGCLRREKPAQPPAREVKIDRERLTPLRDGKPFFAVGIIGVPTNYFPEIAEAGFNTVMRWGAMLGGSRSLETASSPAARGRLITDYLDAARAAGLLVIECPLIFMPPKIETLPNGHYAKSLPETLTEFSAGALPYIIETAGRHPAVFGWESVDEPPHTDWAYRALGDYSRAIRKLDPYHPNLVLFNRQETPGVPDWPDVYDIALHDYYGPGSLGIYPMPTVWWAADYSARMAHANRHPYWHVPLCDLFGNSRNKLTGAMQIAQGYLAVIGGANGLMWWVWPARHADNWAAMRRLAGEFRALMPVLTEPAPRQTVVYTDPGLCGTVRALIKTRGNKSCLIACNASPRPVAAAFTLAELGAGRARVKFEDRDIAIENNLLVDDFDGYARHVYELPGVWPDGGALTINIRQDFSPDAVPSNMITDGGFEKPVGAWAFHVLGAKGTPVDTGNDVALQLVTNAFVAHPRRAGDFAAMIRRTRGNGTSFLRGNKIKLEPDTHYRFGGYAMFEGGDMSMYVYALDDGGYTRQASSIYVKAGSGWQKYERGFRSGSNAVEVFPVVDFRGGAGAGWADGLFLVNLVKADQPDAAGLNLLKNSGFEQEDLPGWPAKWMSGESIGFYHATPVNSGYINAPDSPWALDAAEKYEGRASLRLTRTESRFIPSAWQFGVPLQSNVTYTLSAWMKADRAGLPVRCWYQYNQDAKPLALTTEWQRHTVSFTPPADRSFIAIIPSAPGVVWLDALQLEEGNSATEYVPGAAWQYGERIMGK